MGGFSTAAAEKSADGELLFSGMLSTRNHGGFARVLINLPTPGNLSTAPALGVEYTPLPSTALPAGLYLVVNDGQNEFWGPFAVGDAPGGTTTETAVVEWADLMPRDRWGHRLSMSRATLNRSAIKSVGVMLIAQAGRFEFKIKAIGGTSMMASYNPSPAILDSAEMMKSLIETTIAVGAPVFDAGHPGLCNALYKRTAAQIAMATLIDDLAPSQARIARTIRSLDKDKTQEKQAWDLRSAFNVALLMLRKLLTVSSDDSMFGTVQQEELTLSAIMSEIESAIAVGAPMYNRGDIEGCAELYMETTRKLVAQLEDETDTSMRRIHQYVNLAYCGTYILRGQIGVSCHAGSSRAALTRQQMQEAR
jgi:hypothetical protein